MSSETYLPQLLASFGESTVITTSDLAKFYAQVTPGIPRSTVNWRVYGLVQSGILLREGRGKFTIAKTVTSGNSQAKLFAPLPTSRMRDIHQLIHRRHPFIRYCIWDVREVGQFTQHFTRANFLLLECERELCASVFETAKFVYKSKVFLEPSKLEMDRYVHDARNAIIVRPLISEAPIQSVEGVPTVTLEKLLVDITCDDLFDFVHGKELGYIYENAKRMYQINRDKLFRYSRRKGKKSGLVKSYYERTTHYRQPRVGG